MSSPGDLKVIGIKEMIQRYGISKDTIHRRIQSGHLPKPCKAFVRTRKWFIADLDAWDDKNRTVS